MIQQNEKSKGNKQDYEVGYGKPPKEHQFKPGQSGNPKGPPIRKTQLWVYFCQDMAMTDAELEKLDRTKLSQSQQMALSLVENEAKEGSRALALAIFDRDEGKAIQTQVIQENPHRRRELDEAGRREATRLALIRSKLTLLEEMGILDSELNFTLESPAQITGKEADRTE